MSDNNIKIKVKLTAYTKGIIPDISNLVVEAPADDKLYARKNKEWESFEIPTISTPEDSNILLTKDGADYNIKTKEFTGRESDITEWKDGYTYYIIED